MIIKRKYYSVRNGINNPEGGITLEVLKKMFLLFYKRLNDEGYFQKYFGIECLDGYIDGVLGDDIPTVIFINLRKDNLYPIIENLPKYTEEDLFDAIEFLHDHCSKGIKGTYHSWNQCGMHYEEFDDRIGQVNFRELLNPLLKDFKEGYEISLTGEILVLADEGLSNLFQAKIPTLDNENVLNRVNASILKFRRFGSSIEERKESIRELADVLEFLRPQIKQVLFKKDEADLFNIANGFGIRHHNVDQKTDYDKNIWYSWIFYYYLATIHAIIRMINKKEP